jgi:hypothetical protein
MIRDPGLAPARAAALALGRIPVPLLQLPYDIATITPVPSSSSSSSSSSTPNTVVAAASSTKAASTTATLPAPVLFTVIYALVDATSSVLQSEAETRRNAVTSLVHICEALGPKALMSLPLPAVVTTSATSITMAASTSSSSSSKETKETKRGVSGSENTPTINRDTRAELLALLPPTANISSGSVSLYEYVAAALLRGLDDYSTDNRGDVGSWYLFSFIIHQQL